MDIANTAIEPRGSNRPIPTRAAALRIAAGLAVWLLASITGQADPTGFEELPLDFILSGKCLGEDIQITGSEYLTFRQATDSNGALHVWFHFSFRGEAKGVGVKTGTPYKLVGSGSGSEHVRTSGNETITHQIRFSFIGPGPANNIQAFETTNIKVDANGQLHVSITEAGIECQ